MSKVIDLNLEELEATKLVNDYKVLFNTIKPYNSYQEEIEIYLMAKDCALIAVDKICNLHITSAHGNLNYWLTVKEYIEII